MSRLISRLDYKIWQMGGGGGSDVEGGQGLYLHSSQGAMNYGNSQLWNMAIINALLWGTFTVAVMTPVYVFPAGCETMIADLWQTIILCILAQ